MEPPGRKRAHEEPPADSARLGLRTAKSRRLSQDFDALPRPFAFEMKRSGLFPLTQSQRPVLAAPLGTPGRDRSSPPMTQLEAAIASPMAQEQQSPRLRKPLDGLPALSRILGTDKSPRFGALTTPYRVATATVAAGPSSKQVTKRQPFPFPHGRTLDAGKGISTPILDAGVRVANVPLPSFDDDYLSSDEELLGIPGPDIPDPEVSFSQEKLNDLSVTENNLEETVVLSLCEGLASTLTKAERDRLDLLNLYTISLTQQPSPIILGRDQFQDVFGDSIRGGMISHLSRRHCLIHVENVPSRDDTAKMSVKVRVEDTSTNGIRVNGLQLKNGQIQELELEDVVTLLRIRRGEEDLSLAYRLIRSDPSPRNKKTPRKSRHDGRFVRPSDKFSCELADISCRDGLSPVIESDEIQLSQDDPAQPIDSELRHQIPLSGPHVEAKVQEAMKKEVETSVPEPVQRNYPGMRRIRCTILFADQSTLDFSESSQPFEEANFDYREELSEVLSAFASISSFDTSSYQCATAESIRNALSNDSDVLLYTGGGDEEHLVVESTNGFSARLEKDEIIKIFSEAKSGKEKLLVVILPSSDAAYMLADCGALHVCYLSAASKHSLRVTAFLRALFAGLLKGYSIEKSYTLAEFVALDDLLPIVRPADQICRMLPSDDYAHSVKIGEPLTERVLTDKSSIGLLNALFIPVLATHFLGRDAVVRQVKEALGRKVRVCNIYGARGVGKSSVAVHIAKAAYRMREYPDGVHYFAVDKLVEHVQNGLKPAPTSPQDQESRRTNQREEVQSKIVEGVEMLLRALPQYDERDRANEPTALLIFDGCDVVLPAFKSFVNDITQRFPRVQLLLTSTDELTVSADGALTEQAIHVEELSKMDSAKLFFKLARGHLTSKQFRQLFPGGNIEAISNDERLLGTKGNPFRISRLVYELESQQKSGNQ